MKLSVLVFFLIASILIFWPCIPASAIPARLQQTEEEVTRITTECAGGKPDSCTQLGLLYAHGQGVAKDEKRAAKLYQRACDAGHAPGCFHLGLMYEEGGRIAKDNRWTAQSFKKACDSGHTEACSALKKLQVTAVVGTQSAPRRKDIPAIARDARGAVVSIVMADKDGHPTAQGSGFLVSKDGRVVTNYHVIQHGHSAVVKLPSGAFYDVEGVLAYDKDHDIAIIKVKGQGFRTLSLGDSDRVQVGEEVVAIGNPLSLESTVSNGIVSGVRTIDDQVGNAIQITAPISPGSSGGPLFNMAGEVLGITTFHLKGGENLNFAIPINHVKSLLQAKSSKVYDFPDEEEAASKENSGDETGSSICGFITGRMTAALPQVATFCEEALATTADRRVSVFSPTPVLIGKLRRAWSTALFQALQAAAQNGPCQTGCTVSVSDSQLAFRRMHYETFIWKEGAATTAAALAAMGGFASDEGYLLGWSELLRGRKGDHSSSPEATEIAGRNACEEYVRLLQTDTILAEMLKSEPKLYPRLPTCSVMLATASNVYIVVDFPTNLMATFVNFCLPLSKAFHNFDRYQGAVIFRGRWQTFNDGTTVRYYEQYSLHWLGFVHDELASGVRTDAMSLSLLNGGWVRQSGQRYPNTLFEKGAKAGTIVTRDAAVHEITEFGVSSHVQLTDGTEWTLSTDSLSRCSLKVGDEVSLIAIKPADGEKGVSPSKGSCRLEALFIGAW